MTRLSTRSLTIVISPHCITFATTAGREESLSDECVIPADGLVDNGLLLNMTAMLELVRQYRETYGLTNTKTYCIFDRIPYAPLTLPAVVEYQWRVLCHNSGLQVYAVENREILE